jgi:DNA segregation ATPase FtsK/SpoIIIE-like protein
VSDWRDLDDPPPLLLLVVDEAADFAGTGAMETLTMVGRKGRAFGVSIVVGTQYLGW